MYLCTLFTDKRLNMVKVKVINRGHQPLPQYATPQSAGMDLHANLSEPIVLKPLQRCLVPTGLYISLPEGFEAQVRPRSNLSNEEFIVNDGERIAQMVIARHETADFIEVEELDETERGAGGYGHTGVK